MKRIKKISVTNLFGRFNYQIPLNMENRITIIHGPNGFGKTAILRLLNALFCQNSSVLRKIPFDEFRIDFDDDTAFWVTKSYHAPTEEAEAEKESSALQKIIFHINDRSVEKHPFAWPLKIPFPRNRPAFIRELQISLPLEREGLEIWRYLPTGEILSMEDIVERFGDRLPAEELLEGQPDRLKDIRSSISVRLIEAQRLLNPIEFSKRREYERQPGMMPTVTVYSKELAATIEKKIAESATLNQTLDRTFPARAFGPTVAQSNITENELRSKLAELEKKRSRLMTAGLIDQDNSDAFQMGDQIDDSKKIMLSVYIEDTDKKLGVFDEMADKIDLLTRIINKRFLYKVMTIRREQGFVFITDEDDTLSATDLSSGEQQELVLFYELLFKPTPGSLILIDEPELSLHVVWQEQFLKDVQEITSLNDLDVLIATHSPDIIHDQRDLVVELEGPSNGRVQRVRKQRTA